MVTGRRKACKQWGCPNFHYNKNGYCDECNRKYRAKHPDRYNDDGSKKFDAKAYDERRGTRQQRGYDYTWIKFTKKFLASHPDCNICGAPALCVDHKIATAKQMMDAYGEFSYNEDDYQALCYRCNIKKGQTIDKKMDDEYFKMKDLLKN